MGSIVRREDPDKKEALLAAMHELDRRNQVEYKELTGGLRVNNQLKGGDFVMRKGIPNWHERDTLRIMDLQYRYNNGEWAGAEDRKEEEEEQNAIPLAHKLSAEYVRDLANFIEFQHGDPELVTSLRAQAADALIHGDVEVLYGRGITAQYDIVVEEETHQRGFTYFYFHEVNGEMSLEPSLPPGVTVPDDSEKKAG